MMIAAKIFAGFVVGLAIGWLISSAVIRGLNYWSRRMSVATLFLQWERDA